MAELLHRTQQELIRFRVRLAVSALFVLTLFGLITARLYHLQVVQYKDLATQAENNRIAVVPLIPNRGLIVDRNGVVLANNYSAYTLEITPSKSGHLEPLIEQLSEFVDISPRDRKRFKTLLEESRSFESLPLRTKLSDEEVARFAAQQFRFPGVEVKARLFRNYPLGEIGSHLLGYIGRINQREKEKIEENDDLAPNYKGTEYIGKLGVEQSYEADLHGATGFQEIETTAAGRPVRRIRSHAPVPGDTLVMSIDIRLQALLEKLYGDRRGAMVALNPQTGEILAFVSKPTFDPNLFVDGIDYDSWRDLRESIEKPLLNRVINGTYSPGSTYKPFMALAALATGKRTPQYAISDPGYYWFGGHKFRDDKEGGHGSVSMYKSIVQSCDTYYYMLAADMGVDLIEEHMRPFGLGQITGIDLSGEWRGILPSTEWKQRAYRKPEQKRWYAGETISLGIGQGYNSFTLLQMAHATGVLAAAGQRYKPHLVKEVVDVVNGNKRKVAATPLEPVAIDPEHWAVVHQALVGVNKEGTSAAAFRGAAYVAAGKTGTAQVVGIKANEKYDASKLAEHLLDHALYIAYAPAENPQIALALVVENAGFGAQSAAPIARRAFDYWLQGAYPSEEDMALVQQGKATTPVGQPRRATDIPLPGSPEALAADAMAAASAAASAASAASSSAVAASASARAAASSASGAASVASAAASAAARAP